MEKKKKEKKLPDWDSGITVAPMNGDELPKYRRMAYLNRAKRPSKEERRRQREAYTKKERRAMMRAGFAAMLPYLVIILVAFGIAVGILYLWLS